MTIIIFVLPPTTIFFVYRLIRYGISIHRENKILDKLNSAGVEHALVTKDQILF